MVPLAGIECVFISVRTCLSSSRNLKTFQCIAKIPVRHCQSQCKGVHPRVWGTVWGTGNEAAER
jgi:hypothetical protein